MESDLTDAPFFASPVSAVPRQRCTRLGLGMHIEFVVVFRYGSVAPLCQTCLFLLLGAVPPFFLVVFVDVPCLGVLLVALFFSRLPRVLQSRPSKQKR